MFTSSPLPPPLPHPPSPPPLFYQPVRKLLCLLFVSHIRSTLQIFAPGPEWVPALHPVSPDAQLMLQHCLPACTYTRTHALTHINLSRETHQKSNASIPNMFGLTALLYMYIHMHATKRLLPRYTVFLGKKSLKTKTAPNEEKNGENPTRDSSGSLSILSGDIKSKRLSKTQVHTTC